MQANAHSRPTFYPYSLVYLGRNWLQCSGKYATLAASRRTEFSHQFPTMSQYINLFSLVPSTVLRPGSMCASQFLLQWLTWADGMWTGKHIVWTMFIASEKILCIQCLQEYFFLFVFCFTCAFQFLGNCLLYNLTVHHYPYFHVHLIIYLIKQYNHPN